MKQKKSKIQDIISALFELEKVGFDINIKQHTIADCNPYSGEPFNREIISHEISFRLNYLDNFLAEWMSARTMALKDNKPISTACTRPPVPPHHHSQRRSAYHCSKG